MFHSYGLNFGRMAKYLALAAALCLSWLGTTSGARIGRIRQSSEMDVHLAAIDSHCHTRTRPRPRMLARWASGTTRRFVSGSIRLRSDGKRVQWTDGR
jgi:hypothetical protein